jgi:hypothetical protein
VFLVPCGAELAKELPALCVDPPGIDRVAVHAAVAADAIRFFDANLRQSR